MALALEVIETRVLSVEEHDKDHGQILSRDYNPRTVGRRPKGLLLIRPATRARSSSNASAFDLPELREKFILPSLREGA